MKRILDAGETPVGRHVLPSTSDRPEPAADHTPEQAREQQASANAEPGTSPQAPMIFPGPFAFQAKPPAMGDNRSQSSLQAEPTAAPEEKSATGTASANNKNPVPGAANPNGLPPLILAAYQGDLATLESLLQDPALDINKNDPKLGIPALMAAAGRGHMAVIARLVAAGADLTLRCSRTGKTVLMIASEFNRPEVVKYLLAAGAQVNLAKNQDLATALMLAAKRGHLDVVILLLAHKDIAVDQTDATGMTALHWAAANNRPKVVASLLAAGARVNLSEDRQRLTALMKASWNGHVDVVTALLADKRTAVDQVDSTGITALNWAASGNKPLVVARLLAAGANGNLTGGLQRCSPLMAAVINGHGDVVKTLLTHKVITVDLIDASGQTALHCAATGNKPEMAACLLASGANVNLKNGGGDAALVLAVKNGHLDVVKTLLAHKDIAVDQADANGMNALHWAAFQNKPEIVACLLQAGAMVNMPDVSQRRTALILASGAGHVDVVKALLGYEGVALDVLESSSWSALHLAAYGNKPEVAECLLAAGANVNLLGQSLRTALMLAAEYGHVDLVKLLIRYNAFNALQTDATGQTALHTAVACNKPDVVACLLAAGANLKLVNGVGISAGMHAIVNKQAAVLEVMMQYGLTLPHHDFSDPAHAAFYVTMSDLESVWKPPVPLFIMVTPKFSDIPAQPGLFIAELVARVESGMGLLYWLRARSVRTASALPVVECLSSLAALWPKLANSGKAASPHQKRLICAAALNMLPVLTADGKALAHYKAAGISAAGVASLSAVATQQIEGLIGVSENVLTTLGNTMVNELAQTCMATSASSDRIDIDALRARLVDAGWLAPVAQAIAASWELALAPLKAAPAALPASSSSIKPVSASWRRRVDREAPRLFAQALSRELDSPALIAALRTLIGDNMGAEPIDILFQAQCDQLRQFCEQTGGEG